MNFTASRSEKWLLWGAVAGSVFAGVVNGLLGTGAGIVLTFIFAKICADYSPKDCFVSAMAAVIPISVFSLFTYGGAGEFDIIYMISVVIPAALGGLLGAYIGARARAEHLRRIFALLVIWAGVKMIM